jgi:hypothetical protein
LGEETSRRGDSTDSIGEFGARERHSSRQSVAVGAASPDSSGRKGNTDLFGAVFEGALQRAPGRSALAEVGEVAEEFVLWQF